MNVLETILVCFLILLYITTWIAEPRLSIEYSKEYFKSGVTVYHKVAKFFKGVNATTVNDEKNGDQFQ